MREIIICEIGWESVDVIDDVVEISVVDYKSGRVLIKIDKVTWDKICKKVIEDMAKGATGGEEVE